jgi:hypothetical protein
MIAGMAAFRVVSADRRQLQLKREIAGVDG